MMNKEYFGITLRFYRRKNGWSQEKLAEELGISTRTVQRLESGELPSLLLADAIAEKFHIGLEDLLGEKNSDIVVLRDMLGSMNGAERNLVRRLIAEIEKLV